METYALTIRSLRFLVFCRSVSMARRRIKEPLVLVVCEADEFVPARLIERVTKMRIVST